MFRRSRHARLLAGLWELPWTECASGSSLASSLAEKYGGEWRLGDSVGRVRHSITHRRFAIDAYVASWRPDGVGEPQGGRHGGGWHHRDEIAELATSSLVPKVLGRAATG